MSWLVLINQNKVVKGLKLKNILFKFLTLWLVQFYYSQMENVEERLLQNDNTLWGFLVWQHLIACIPFDYYDQLYVTKDKVFRVILVVCLGLMLL